MRARFASSTQYMTTTIKEIVVFGASGGTGRELVRQALHNNYRVTVFVRDSASFKPTEGLKIIQGNINNSDQVRDAIRGKYAVLSALGVSRTLHHDPEVVSGIRTIVEAMNEESVSRLIYLSVFLAEAELKNFSFFVRHILNNVIRKEVIDHEAKEKIVVQHVKAFTIVRATRLKSQPLTGKYKSGETINLNDFLPSVTRGDVAHFMLRQLNDNTYINKKVSITGA